MNEKMKELGYAEVAPAALDTLDFNPFQKIGKDWFLVTAGNEKGWNTMTAAWGFAGFIWGVNAFTTVIRPQRYTKEFVDGNDYFTVSFFGEDMRKALSFCGSHSGRDCDKAAETGLKPVFISDKSSACDNECSFDVTAFEQARLVLVCKKAYVQEMRSECFAEKCRDEKWNAAEAPHIQYIGEIIKAYIKEE